MSSRILLSIFLLSSISVCAQQFGSTKTIIGKTTDGLSYTHADIDEDGDEDILVGGEGKLRWLENNGNGDFITEHLISHQDLELYPNQVEAADVNGDQHVDVIVRSNNSAQRLILFTGDGLGNFSEGVHVVSNSYLGGFALSDLDGDTDMDLLLVMTSPLNDLQIYENDGTGNFTYAALIGDVGTSLATAICGELGGSALPDILACSISDNKVVWYENTGSLTFSAQMLVSTDHDYPRDLGIADLNGDSDNDIIVSSYNDEGLAWFENMGSSTFGTQNIILVGEEYPNFVAKDVDGDSDIDLLTDTGTDEVMVLHTNDGNANFAAPVVLSNVQPHFYFDAFDVDNDSDVDPIFASFSGGSNNGSLRYIPNTNNTGFTGEEMLTFGLNFVEAHHYADLDNDGWQDVLSISSGDNTVYWSRNLGGGIFDLPIILSDSVDNVQSVLAIDIDNDTDMDVLAVERGYGWAPSNNRVHIYLNDGNGGFSLGETLHSPSPGGNENYSFVSAADLTGNGFSDVVVTAYTTGSIYVFKNLGGMSFTSLTAYSSNVSTQTVELADINGDTFLDLVYLTESAGEVRWQANDGNGNFSTAVEIDYPAGLPNFSAGISLEIEDMDGDTDMDLLVSVRVNYTTTTQSSMKLFYLVNDGSANFNTHVLVLDDYGIAWDTEIADLDGDNDLDIAILDIWGAAWLRNDGGGAYYREYIDSLSPGGAILQGNIISNRSLQLVDLDNDTDLDVVHSNLVEQYKKRQVKWSANGAVDCNVLPTLSANVTSPVCEEVPVTLTATGGTTFTWNNGLPDQASHVVLPMDTTTYVVTISDGGSCTLTDSITVDVIQGPEPTVVLNGSNLETQLFGTYQWLLNGVSIAGETAQETLPISNGDYAVIVTDNATMCSDTSEVYTVLTVGVEQNESPQFTVYPNPSNGPFTLKLERTYGAITISIRDLLGKVVSSQDATNLETIRLDLNGTAGVYFLDVEVDGTRLETQLILLSHANPK